MPAPSSSAARAPACRITSNSPHCPPMGSGPMQRVNTTSEPSAESNPGVGQLVPVIVVLPQLSKLKRSDTAQSQISGQATQSSPPQSMSVSDPFNTWSLHVDALQIPLSQTPDSQCSACSQRPASGHGRQTGPPQSTSVSAPSTTSFRHDSGGSPVVLAALLVFAVLVLAVCVAAPPLPPTLPPVPPLPVAVPNVVLEPPELSLAVAPTLAPVPPLAPVLASDPVSLTSRSPLQAAAATANRAAAAPDDLSIGRTFCLFLVIVRLPSHSHFLCSTGRQGDRK